MYEDDIFEGQDVHESQREEMRERIVDIGPQNLMFYEKLRQKAKDWTKEKTGKTGNKVAEYLFLLPDLFILVSRLAVDKRVPMKRKMMLAGVIAYVVMPLDIIPDFIPVLGYVDDLVIVVMGLNMLLNDIDQHILEDNWSGEGNILHLLQKITATADQFLDRNVMRRIRRWFKRYKR